MKPLLFFFFIFPFLSVAQDQTEDFILASANEEAFYGEFYDSSEFYETSDPYEYESDDGSDVPTNFLPLPYREIFQNEVQQCIDECTPSKRTTEYFYKCIKRLCPRIAREQFKIR